MSDLDEQEVAVLMLSEKGQSMMAIGHWEKPIDNLVQRGFLKRFDKFNHEITPEGRKALSKHESGTDEDYRKMLTVGAQIADARLHFQEYVEASAKDLLASAKCASVSTGESIQAAILRAAPLVQQRALEMAKS